MLGGEKWLLINRFVITLSEHFIKYLFDLFFGLIKYSAAVAYPLRGLMHCVFRDAPLHTTVAMRGYLRYCHVPVTSLTTLINTAFLPSRRFFFCIILC